MFTEYKISRMHILRLTKARTGFLCCDIQDAFRSTVFRFEHVLTVASHLVQAGRIFGIPVVVSEQYPEKLGSTSAPIDVNGATVYSKTCFSMITPEFPQRVLDEKDAFVVFGIETHVCVQQTVLDLLALGKRVVVVTDAVSSSRELDRSTALHRMSASGAVLMTAESVMFELMRSKDCEEFKQISALAKLIGLFTRSNPSLSSL